MCKRYRCKPKAIKVLHSTKGNFRYNKFNEVIEKAQMKSSEKPEWYNIVDEIFICFFSFFGFFMLILGMYCMWLNVHKGAYLVMLSIFISTVPIFTYLDQKLRRLL